MTEYLLANTIKEYNAANCLFKEYAATTGIDLSFQNFDNELKELRKMYAAPTGGIILCRKENDYAGCVAIRKLSEKIGELKRMYVKPQFQNFGIGKALLKNALKLAEDCKYKWIRLDTLDFMQPAIHLYKQNGFYEIEPYYNNPNATAIFFEKNL